MIKSFKTIQTSGVKQQLTVPSNKSAVITNSNRFLKTLYVSDSNKGLNAYTKFDLDYRLEHGEDLVLPSGTYYVYHKEHNLKGTVSFQYAETSAGGTVFVGSGSGGGGGGSSVNIEDTLTSNATSDALSANMGRVLNETKVDKVAGKVLSTEDYTSAEKAKLAGIESNANNYTLPISSGATLGGVRIGSGLSIDASGIISLNAPQSSINDNSDVDISTTPIQVNETIRWDGSKFVPSALGGGGSTDLSVASVTATTLDIVSSNGNNATVPQATNALAGLLSGPDKTKLDGIEADANNYTHPSSDGNMHVPANGTTNSGKVLTAGATAGTYTWEIVSSSSGGVYTQDGTLTSDRTITLNGNSFTVNETNGRIILTDTFSEIESHDVKTARVKVENTGTVVIVSENGLSVNGSVGNANEVLTSSGANTTPQWEAISVSNSPITSQEATTDWNNA